MVFQFRGIPGPNPRERRLVARCLLQKGVWIGNEDEIWGASHSLPYAMEALGTLRECLIAVVQIVGVRMAVTASSIQAYVLQLDGLAQVPYVLVEMAEFLVEDSECRAHWQSLVSDDRFPHRCPFCGAAAYVGFNSVDCRAKCR